MPLALPLTNVVLSSLENEAPLPLALAVLGAVCKPVASSPKVAEPEP